MDHRRAAQLVDKSMIWSSTRAGQAFWSNLEDRLNDGRLEDAGLHCHQHAVPPKSGLTNIDAARELMQLLRTCPSSFPTAIRELSHVLGEQGNAGPGSKLLLLTEVKHG